MDEFEKYRARDLIGSEKLVAAANRLLKLRPERSARGNLPLSVNSRIARHYLGEGLLGEPTRQDGTDFIYNYGNLLRVVAVKILLADYWSLAKTREFLALLDLTALEQFINGQPAAISGSQAQRNEPLPIATDRSSPRPVSLFSPATTPRPLVKLALDSAQRAAGTEWIELAPGLEIRLHRGFRRPRSGAGEQNLIDRFRVVALGPSTDKE
ncbi:MAG: hypothetical protein ABIP75_20150 [Pyrinomonadaceae bacterium]